jgi:hypothetical protein
MGGRNGGAMGKSKVDKVKQPKKNKVVTMPRTNTGEDAEASGNGEEKDAAERIEEEDHKGARKALRQAVKTVVKVRRAKIAEKLVEKTEDGDAHCAAMVLSLMEKKKDGEDDNWDGPGLADILVPGQLWKEKTAAKEAANDEEEKTKAA